MEGQSHGLEPNIQLQLKASTDAPIVLVQEMTLDASGQLNGVLNGHVGIGDQRRSFAWVKTCGILN